MATSPLLYIDPAAVPLTIEQESRLFAVPRELRDRIYGFIFQGENRTSNAEVASPLLICRQFYAEARVIAFSNIDWRINWDQVIRKYFDGKAILPNGEPFLDSLRLLPVPDTASSTRCPLDFTLSRIISRAVLSNQQHTALRRMHRLTISGYWNDIWQIYKFESGLLYHFLDGLSEFFVSDMQLECLTFETIKPLDCLSHEPLSRPKFAVTQHWRPDFALLWARRLTQTILLRDGTDPKALETAKYEERPPNMDDITWKHRIPCSNHLFLVKYKIVAKAGCGSHGHSGPSSYEYILHGEFDFDSAENPRQWQWSFGKERGSSPFDEDQFDHIKITHKNSSLLTPT